MTLRALTPARANVVALNGTGMLRFRYSTIEVGFGTCISQSAAVFCVVEGKILRRLLLISLLTCLGCGPVLADAEIGGWTVSAKPDANGSCLAARSYNDKDDDNKKNSVVFGLIKNNGLTQTVLVLGYEGWNFDKDEAVVGDLIIDGKTIYKKWKWEGDGKVLTAVFGDTAVIPVFAAGKKVVLRFGADGEANFLIPNAGLALGAVQLCMG